MMTIAFAVDMASKKERNN